MQFYACDFYARNFLNDGCGLCSLLVHSDFRGSSARKCLERFFAFQSFSIRKEIPIILKKDVNTTELEIPLRDPIFLSDDAFITDDQPYE